MTIDSFLEHWQLIEHPFRGEEARQDPLLSRMVDASVRMAAENPLRPSRMPRHPDYDKIAGEFSRPSTSIVFGEKGSGKTAIRLQMSTSATAFNAGNPSKRVLRRTTRPPRTTLRRRPRRPRRCGRVGRARSPTPTSRRSWAM